jgi:hypothetical protein
MHLTKKGNDMRFARFFELLHLKKQKSKPKIEEKKVQTFPRTPKHVRTGEKITEEKWDEIMGVGWSHTDEWKLRVLRKYYPTPVTAEIFHRELGEKGRYVLASFTSINNMLYRNHRHRLPYKIEAEGAGFQIFTVTPIH